MSSVDIATREHRFVINRSCDENVWMLHVTVNKIKFNMFPMGFALYYQLNGKPRELSSYNHVLNILLRSFKHSVSHSISN